MTDEPDLTEIQERIMEALAIQNKEADFDPSVSAGISDEKLARQLGSPWKSFRRPCRG